MKRKTTMKDKRHFAKVAQIGCVACLQIGHETPDVEIHHINSGGMGMKSSNDKVIPLCHAHHRTGGYGVAVHAGLKEFERIYGTEQSLLEMANELL